MVILDHHIKQRMDLDLVIQILQIPHLSYVGLELLLLEQLTSDLFLLETLDTDGKP